MNSKSEKRKLDPWIAGLYSHTGKTRLKGKRALGLKGKGDKSYLCSTEFAFNFAPRVVGKSNRLGPGDPELEWFRELGLMGQRDSR